MSYAFIAIGTRDEAVRAVTRACDTNASPEMPLVKEVVTRFLANIEGDDKRVLVKANGWHIGGLVSHNIVIESGQVVPPAEPPS